jgi:hypothetical protein
MATSTIAGRRFELDAASVETLVRDVLPEPLRDHYVVVGARRYPPKQVLGLATGLDRADFTTHQARRTLQRLGFTVGRVSTATSPPRDPRRADWPHGGREAQALQPYQGQWVAQRGLDVLVAADSPERVIAWLNQHDERDATVFRVPASAAETDTAAVR